MFITSIKQACMEVHTEIGGHMETASQTPQTPQTPLESTIVQPTQVPAVANKKRKVKEQTQDAVKRQLTYQVGFQ